jgi:oxygen-independent coproporphyrinogen-3 oxidase
MVERLQKNNFIQYEISNFGKEHFFSKHNSNYWKGSYYLGLGPSAHSFDGKSRQWNVANNNGYIQKISGNDVGYFEKEILTKNNHFNEYILTSLRTIWGINLNYLNTHFNTDFISILKKEVENHIKNETIILKDNAYILTNKGKLLADKIASDLFV